MSILLLSLATCEAWGKQSFKVTPFYGKVELRPIEKDTRCGEKGVEADINKHRQHNCLSDDNILNPLKNYTVQ